MDILKLAQEAAMDIIEEDRHLMKEENRPLREMLMHRFKDKLDQLSLN